MSGWRSRKRRSRGTSHLLAKEGMTLTVKGPLRPLAFSRHVASPSRWKDSRTGFR